ncbi:Uncharacterised protein [Mycobacterium tuberculosis]|nr:Uncharacterised protein [Mycobacterium tuberculosis]
MADAVVRLLVVGLARRRQPLDDGGGIQRPALGVLADGVVHGGLDALDVDGEVGVLDVGDLPGGQLQVVRLGSGPGERPHEDVVSADPLRQPRHRVERRDHGRLAGRDPGVRVGAGRQARGEPGQGQGRGDGAHGIAEADHPPIMDEDENGCQNRPTPRPRAKPTRTTNATIRKILPEPSSAGQFR